MVHVVLQTSKTAPQSVNSTAGEQASSSLACEYNLHTAVSMHNVVLKYILLIYHACTAIGLSRHMQI